MMTETEALLFPRVGCGCQNVLPILLYIFQEFSEKEVVKILNYLIKNNIVGMHLVQILMEDFNGDLDKLIKWTLKTNSERIFKL